MKYLSTEKFLLYFLNLFKKKHTGISLIQDQPEILDIKKQMINYTKENLTTEKIAKDIISNTTKFYTK